MEERRKRVLIVDDDVNLIKVMKIYFQRSGMEAEVASSGRKAIKAVDTFQPDVIILDIRMPKVDGVDVCNNIRKQKGLKNMPIIALTGYHSEKSKRAILEAGANLYLNKPIDMSSLLKHVKGLLASVRPTA
jgi:DNA-binding response OmpR family regulator